MEQLLHYVWKHKIFPFRELRTVDGRAVEVLNPGISNTNAGPDFTGASVKIDGMVWVGNVEVHMKTSDWFRHHHDQDSAYDTIVLHVAAEVDAPLYYPDGREVPQLQLEVPQYVRDNYEQLRLADRMPRCKHVVSGLPEFQIHNWMTSLMLERFEERTRQILARRELLDKDWENTLFVTLARSFGFGINGDAFETWAKSVPMSAVAKHRDSLFQVEALFFGQAGLLEGEGTDDYYLKLQKEYRYLMRKFTLKPIASGAWKFLRLRPQNFPHIRIAQLAMMYYEQRMSLSRLINARTVEEMDALLLTHVSEYWQTRYTFGGRETKVQERALSVPTKERVIVNALAPVLFAYGKYKSDQSLCERAFTLWEQLPPECNKVTREWASAGVVCESAADSQALIQLSSRYCQPRDCLRCRFGYEYIKQTPDLLRENE